MKRYFSAREAVLFESRSGAFWPEKRHFSLSEVENVKKNYHPSAAADGRPERRSPTLSDATTATAQKRMKRG